MLRLNSKLNILVSPTSSNVKRMKKEMQYPELVLFREIGFCNDIIINVESFCNLTAQLKQ